MIRWAVLATAMAGCLDSPPAAVAGPQASLALAGVTARGDLDLDGHDDLVITGIRRDDTGELPVALVLFASTTGMEAAVAGGGIVELEVDPREIAMTRREDVTGLAVLLAPDGSLSALDEALDIAPLVPTDGDSPLDRAFGHVATLETSPGQRLLLSQTGDLWVTDPIEGESDLSDIPADLLASGAAIEWLDGVDVAGSHVVASVTAAGEIDARVFMSGDPPTLEPDLVSESTQTALGSVLWRGTSHDFLYLIGIDRDIPRVFWHRTPLGAGEITSGFVLEDTYDVIFDISFAVVGGGAPDLLVLGERGGALVVDMYGDPMANDAFDIGSPASWTVTGDVATPAWIDAMDAVGDTGNDEIIVYDQAGHIACADRNGPGNLVSCGNADLVEMPGG